MKKLIFSLAVLTALVSSGIAHAQSSAVAAGFGGLSLGGNWSEAGLTQVKCGPVEPLKQLLTNPDKVCSFLFAKAPTFVGQELAKEGSVALKNNKVLMLSGKLIVNSSEGEAEFEKWIGRIASTTKMTLQDQPGELLLTDPTLAPGVTREKLAASQTVLFLSKPPTVALHLGSFELLQAVSETSRP